ncbi:putative zinc finger protein 66 [Malaya genurostris]|uniref:putative zinc finger protein 66 n=1 Tax=Malaya genurostris TaxID=325434 RepID=UPI0026F3C048|nr:putative zinc finger protein 66 [Malaya genurostris]
MEGGLQTHLLNLYVNQQAQQRFRGPVSQPFEHISDINREFYGNHGYGPSADLTTGPCYSYVDRVSDWLGLPTRKIRSHRSDAAFTQERHWDNISEVSEMPTEAGFTVPPPTLSPEMEINERQSNWYNNAPEPKIENQINQRIGSPIHLNLDVDQQFQAVAQNCEQFGIAESNNEIETGDLVNDYRYQVNPFVLQVEQHGDILQNAWHSVHSSTMPPPNGATDNIAHRILSGPEQTGPHWYQDQTTLNTWNSMALQQEYGVRMEQLQYPPLQSLESNVPDSCPIKIESHNISPEYSVMLDVPQSVSASTSQPVNQSITFDSTESDPVDHYQTPPNSMENSTSPKSATANNDCTSLSSDAPSEQPKAVGKRKSSSRKERSKPSKRHNILGEKFYCAKCDRYFLKQNGFTQHLDVYHMGPRPHICTCCGKRFRELERLRVHEKCHNGQDKPYKCSDCPKGFQHVQAMRRHFVMHHSKPSLFCDVCGKGFVRNDHLMSHLVSHQHNRVKPRKNTQSE